MKSDMEREGGKRKQEKEETGSDACFLDVDAEAERCPKKARKELEMNMSNKPEDAISLLPELAQDKVFGFLGVKDKMQAAQVCSSWRDAVYRPCQWKEVKVTLDLDKLSEEAVSSLQHRKIRHLEVKTFDVQSTLVDRLHGCLFSLDLSRKALPVSVLQKVFCKSFISLRELHVSMDDTEPLVFARVHEVLQHLSNLEHLDLSVDECDNDVFQAVGRNLKSLKHFSLTASDRVACNLEFLDHLNSLQSLCLENSSLSGIDYLKSSCKTLKKVSLRRCDFNTDEWPEIVSQVTSLEELKLSQCKPYVRDGLRQLTQGQRNLKVLMYDPSFPSYFVFDPRSLAQMSSLEKLSVSYCRLESDADLRALSLGLKNLRSLEMTRCDNLSAAFMTCIAGLSSLQELSLQYSRDVDGRTLEMISNGSCQLRKLDLRGCHKIRGEDMRHVAEMSSLRELILLDLKLGPSGINYLKEGTLRLEALTLARFGCTFQDVKPWLEKQQSLQCLRMWYFGMAKADRTEAENLKEVLPFLRKVVIFR